MSRVWVLRVAPIGIFAVLMALFGWSVYRVLGHFSHLDSGSGALARPQDPRSERPAIVVPGTIYVAQDGDLYALQNGQFTLVAPHGEAGQWMQPTVMSDGRLLAVDVQAGGSNGFDVGSTLAADWFLKFLGRGEPPKTATQEAPR